MSRSERREDEGFIPSNPAAPAKTDKSLEIASIPTSIHFALSLKFIVSHCFTHKNCPLDIFYLRSLYFTRTYIGPCTEFFKTLFFQPYTDSHFKNPLFSILLFWDVKILSQRLQMVIIVDFYNI